MPDLRRSANTNRIILLSLPCAPTLRAAARRPRVAPPDRLRQPRYPTPVRPSVASICTSRLGDDIVSVLGCLEAASGYGSEHAPHPPAHSLRRGRLQADPPEPVAVRRQDPLPAAAGGGALCLSDPPAPLRQVALGIGARELLRPLLGRRLRGHLRRHRHRAGPDRGTEPLRHPALRLFNRQRQARNPGAGV